MAESKEEVFNLFYPWFYQGEMSSQMVNYKADLENGKDILKSNKEELIRLYKDFDNIDLTDKVFLLHIGANCNEYNYEEASQKILSLNNCKLRLIPPFFIESVINIGLSGVIFIVDNFGDNSDISNLSAEYMTIKKTDTINKYYIPDYDITIYVYNTYFPTYLDENMYYTVDRDTTEFIIEKRRQSSDKEFIINFYRKLESTLLKSVFSVVLSTASFRDANATSQKVLKNTLIKGEYKINPGSGNLDLELYREINNIIKNKKIIFIIWPFESDYFFILKHLVKFDYRLPVIQFYIDDSNEIVLLGKKGYVTDIKLVDIRLSNYIEYFKDKKRYKTIIE